MIALSGQHSTVKPKFAFPYVLAQCKWTLNVRTEYRREGEGLGLGRCGAAGAAELEGAGRRRAELKAGARCCRHRLTTTRYSRRRGRFNTW